MSNFFFHIFLFFFAKIVYIYKILGHNEGVSGEKW